MSLTYTTATCISFHACNYQLKHQHLNNAIDTNPVCVCFSAKTDRAFKEFLDARNPNKQHSSTLESYLIKPVQRVLKYPLLLRELVSLTDADSEEHYHLTGKGRNIYSH